MNVTINEVTSKSGEGKKGPWTLYTAKTSGGMFKTFKHELGAQLHEGQTVDIVYEKKQDGDYIDKIIQGIKPISDMPKNIPSKDKSICYSYAKDIVVALINKGIIVTTDNASAQVIRVGDHIFNGLTGVDDLDNL